MPGGPEAVEPPVGDLLGHQDAGHPLSLTVRRRALPADLGRSWDLRLSSVATDCTNLTAVPRTPALEAPLHKRPLRLLAPVSSPSASSWPPAATTTRARTTRRPPPATTPRPRWRDESSSQVSLDDLCQEAQGRRRRGARRLHRPPRHRHRQGRRPDLQPVRLRGHDGGRGVLRLRDELHRDGRPRPTTPRTSPPPSRAARTSSSPSASCSPPTPWPPPTANPDTELHRHRPVPAGVPGQLHRRALQRGRGRLHGRRARRLAQRERRHRRRRRPRGRPAGRQAGERLRGRAPCRSTPTSACSRSTTSPSPTPDKGASDAEQFIGEGADVIFGAGGKTGSGGVAAADGPGRVGHRRRPGRVLQHLQQRCGSGLRVPGQLGREAGRPTPCSPRSSTP